MMNHMADRGDDWLDDDDLSFEEAMERFEALGPDVPISHLPHGVQVIAILPTYSPVQVFTPPVPAPVLAGARR